MTEKENELLNEDINRRINDIRYEKNEEEKNKKSLFYLTVVILVTLSVLFSLFYKIF